MVSCIVNPISAGGRTASLLPHLREALADRFGSSIDLFVTSARGDARRAAAFLLHRSPHAFIITVGGDGTLQEVVNGWMDAGVDSTAGACLGLISSGTGQGLAQGLRLPCDVRGQLDVLVQGERRRMDLGFVRYSDGSTHSGSRYFVNECQLGIGGAVVQDVEGRPKRWSGRWTFGTTALREALSLPNRLVRISRDGGEVASVPMLGLVFGNGEFTGGGMNLTPGADPFDGQLDLLTMGAQSVCRRIANLSRIYSARHIGRPEFSLHRCLTASITSAEPIEVEADGEFLGSTPCDVSVVPSALTIMVPRRPV